MHLCWHKTRKAVCSRKRAADEAQKKKHTLS